MEYSQINRGNYYTGEPANDRLISALDCRSLNQVIDLGSGAGSLTNAALARWPEATVYCVDITHAPLHGTSIRKKNNIVITNADVLTPDFDQRVASRAHDQTVIVSNPPFLKRPLDDYIASTLSSVGLGETADRKSGLFPAHYGFLAQSLKLLTKAAEAAIILPESFLSGERYRRTRAELVARFFLRKVVEYPSGNFTGTEARCYALYIRCGKTEKPIDLVDYKGNGIAIEPKEFEHRGDPKYYTSNSSRRASSFSASETLWQLGFSIVRGSLPGSYRNRSDDVCHTSDLTHGPPYLLTWRNGAHPTSTSTNSSPQRAAPGDVLIARVGSRVVGNIAYVKEGNPRLTDCVFRLRPHTESAKQSITGMLSPKIENYLRTVARGTCAHYLTKDDLFRLIPESAIYD